MSSGLRNTELVEEEPETSDQRDVGEDTRLAIATATARGYSLVTRSTPMLDQLTDTTMLMIVEP